MDKQQLALEIIKLRQERGAVILAHNYQRPEIQDLADYTGDSLGLSQQATRTGAEVIVFCGVSFMAETAFILNPDKTILLPEAQAGCPLADMIDVEGLCQLKGANPGTPVVCYVNSSAAVKAQSDICCTSANAVKVVASLPGNKVIFIPDKNLGAWVARQTSKEVIVWPGYCPTHHHIKVDQIVALKKVYPEAEFMAHPECEPEVLEMADHICSTSGMYAYARQSKAKTLIVGSEMGMLHRLQKENPKKTFLLPSKNTICPNMKLTTLKKVRRSLAELSNKVVVDETVRRQAFAAVSRMMALD